MHWNNHDTRGGDAAQGVAATRNDAMSLYDSNGNEIVSFTKNASGAITFTVNGIAKADGTADVLVYRGIIAQSGTAAPTIAQLESGLSAVLAPARTSAGIYTFTLTGAFTSNKTFVLASLADNATAKQIQAGPTSANVITVNTFNGSGTAADLVGSAHLLILVYP